MAWTDGVTRATGYLVSAADWNNHHGASGNDMELKLHTHDGTAGDGSGSLGPLVLGDFTDAAAPAAPGAGKTRIYATAGRPAYRAGAAGADTPLADNVHKTRHEPGGADAMAVDAAVGTGSLRTIGTGQQQAAGGDHSHSGALIAAHVNAVLGGGTTSYLPPATSNAFLTEATVQIPMPRAGTAKRLYVRTSTAQGANGSLVFTIRKNGVATTVTLTIAASGAAGTYSDLVNTVAWATGDLMSLEVVNNHNLASANVVGWSLEYA